MKKNFLIFALLVFAAGCAQSNQEASNKNTFGQEIFDTFQEAGYDPTDVKITKLCDDNTQTEFTATIAKDVVIIDAVDAKNVGQTKKIFDANEENDESHNMSVTAQAQTGPKKVEVIRNDQNNTSYIEAINLDNSSTVHIQTSSDKQLDPVLLLLEELGFPKAK